MKPIKILSLIALGALLTLVLGAIKDETGTTRFRQGAVLSFDPQVTLKDEDGAWTMGNTQLGYLANGGSSAMAWTVSALTLGSSTNQIVFTSTNNAPADTNAILWISVKISGDTNSYRIGLAK